MPPSTYLSQVASEARGKWRREGGCSWDQRLWSTVYRYFQRILFWGRLGIHWMPALRAPSPSPWIAPPNIPSFCGLFQFWIWAGCMTQFNQDNKAEVTLGQLGGLSYQKVWQLQLLCFENPWMPCKMFSLQCWRDRVRKPSGKGEAWDYIGRARDPAISSPAESSFQLSLPRGQTCEWSILDVPSSSAAARRSCKTSTISPIQSYGIMRNNEKVIPSH